MGPADAREAVTLAMTVQGHPGESVTQLFLDEWRNARISNSIILGNILHTVLECQGLLERSCLAQAEAHIKYMERYL